MIVVERLVGFPKIIVCFSDFVRFCESRRIIRPFGLLYDLLFLANKERRNALVRLPICYRLIFILGDAIYTLHAMNRTLALLLLRESSSRAASAKFKGQDWLQKFRIFRCLWMNCILRHQDYWCRLFRHVIGQNLSCPLW